jgi:hypothetical protein
VGGPASTATAVTFDSFATRLLAEVDPDGDWVDRDYDGRIDAAAHEISSETEAQQIIGHYRHVIVDELQDLVAVRADLVRAILSASECGFTLFGDPAQGIYNFQAEGTERVRGAHLLFEWLHTTFPHDLDHRALSTNFRVETPDAEVALWAGAELNQAQPDYPRIKAGLERVVMDLDPLGDLDTLVTMLRGIPADRLPTTAVLCRYNGQALMISQALAGAGVPHRYQRSATERAVAPWVARALRGFDQGPIGRSRLMAAIEDLDDPDAPSGHEAWSLLKRLDGRRSDNLDLGRVQARLRTGDVPDELTPLLDSKIVVSTIHRAKGLEFSRVVLVDPGQLTEDDLEMPEEVRLLYVALTRSRNELWRMTSPETWGLSCRGNPEERWVRRGRDRWRVLELEIRGRDSFAQDPAGAFAVSGDPAGIQAYIDKCVSPGDAVRLELVVRDGSGGGRAYYRINHRDHSVGVVDLGWLIWNLLRPRHPWNWPNLIDGLYVESVDTVAGTSAAGDRAGLGPSGIWLRVRTYGLGRLHWPPREDRDV